ncbi:MAG: GNAT family N-acetyltransferase [Verrucomicrobiota bacterium]
MKMNRVKLFTPPAVKDRVMNDWAPKDLLIRRSMKLLRWIRFTWNLTTLPPLVSELPEHYQIAPATDDDQLGLRKVFSSSFVLDPFWNPAVQEVTRTVDAWLDQALVSDLSTCLVLRHGRRIIGASVLSFDPEAQNHLAPGPSVMMEYRNRGFGTLLFERSLSALREAGLVRAGGIARENAPVARFLYPKFGGVPEPTELAPLLAA